MVKSSPDAEIATDLIFRVRGLCAAGVLSLTKFVRNNVEVMQLFLINMSERMSI